jgi:hypothetical protein
MQTATEVILCAPETSVDKSKKGNKKRGRERNEEKKQKANK